MKNRAFILIVSTVSMMLVLYFLTLIFGLLPVLGRGEGAKAVNWAEVFFSIKLTLWTSVISTALALLFAVPCAYLLSRHSFPFKNIVETLLYLPIVISPIALGAMALIFSNTPPGRFVENRLIHFIFETPGIILAQFMVIVGLAINLIKAVFDYVDPEYENIARTLGATKAQAFFKNLLPVSARGIVTAGLLTWARAVGEFGATVTIAGATPFKTETLPVAIFLAFASANIQNAIIYILISLSIALSVLFIIIKINAQYHRTF